MVQGPVRAGGGTGYRLVGAVNAGREPWLCGHLPETLDKVLDLFASRVTWGSCA